MRRATLVGVVLLTLAGGCIRTEAGQPPSSGTVGTSAGASASSPARPTSQLAAPAVANPKDARGLRACDLLTPDQLNQLGLNPSSRREVSLPEPFDAGCAWTAADSSWGVGFGFDTTRNGLSETYLRRASYQHFEPREIGGYPAVDAQTSYNAEDCYTFVGIADNQQLNINVDNRRTDRPACERLDEIVKMIIGNLPPLK